MRVKAWRKWQKRLQELQGSIQNIRANLNIIIASHTSRSVAHVQVDIEGLSRTTSNESVEQATFRTDITRSLATHQTHLTNILDGNLQHVDIRMDKLEQLLMLQTITTPASPDEAQPISIGGKEIDQRSRSSSMSGTRSLADPYPLSTSLGIQVKNASAHCAAQGYSGLPLLSPTCDLRTCKASQLPTVTAEYWFPLGFCWSTVLRLQMAYHAQLGPQIAMSTLRSVPDSAQCVIYALEGNIDGLQSLFDQGLASPKDISITRGYTLLRWALYGQKYEACRFLLAAGADPDHKPKSDSDNCPSDKACDIILRGGLSQQVEEIMRLVAQSSDFIDSQRFTKLHKIVLGLSFSDLQQEILVDPEGLDQPDAGGRTTLEWAAARGDASAVAILLGHGADPNNMDMKLNTPLTLAANQDHAHCVELLLKAGAKADPVLPRGVKFGTPLNCAARNATNPLVVKLLLDFGADIEARGVDGVSPLLHAARGKPASFAKLLLDRGADLNATSRDGRTPLTTAIMYNDHGILRLLLARWLEYTSCPRLKGPHLLELVARNADVETIDILSANPHLKFKGDSLYAYEKLSTLLQQRVDVTKSLIAAFEDLLRIVREVPRHVNVSNESLMEQGFVGADRDTDGDSGSDKEDYESDESNDIFEDAQEGFTAAGRDFVTFTKRTKRSVII